ncbi:hypothetical protein LguiA_027929 [Lonicera macranthoides]
MKDLQLSTGIAVGAWSIVFRSRIPSSFLCLQASTFVSETCILSGASRSKVARTRIHRMLKFYSSLYIHISNTEGPTPLLQDDHYPL